MRQKGRFLAGVGAVCCGLVAAPRVAFPAEDAPLVALVIDTSGSVGRPGLARSKMLITGVLSALGSGSEVAVFTFDDRARVLLRRTGDAGAIRTALSKALVSGRGTALNDALYDAARYLRDTGAATSAIVLVTDGRDEGSALNLDDGLDVAEEARIRVFTVGVGRPDEKVLRRIAKLTGGDYVPAARANAATLAARIRARSPAAVAPQAGSPAPVARPSDSPAAQPSPDAASDSPVRADSPARTSFPWLLAAALLALGLGGAWMMTRRGKARPRCTGCGRPLTDVLASCPFCAEPGSSATTDLPTARSDLSPTVLARLNVTEEYLDRTVSLQECPVLSITRGQGAGRTFELSRASALSVGRARANDVVLDDVAVSSQHCRIRPENGGFVVHDLKSTNGTFVNDRRVSHHPLAEGDVIQIGETWLQYKLEHRRA
jgi:predicted component of type VI protein secretion system